MNYYGYHGFGFFGFALSAFWQILVVVFIVWLIFRIVRGPRSGRWTHMHGIWQSHSAMNILNERFAKGEISKEEYEERKKTLMGQG